MTRVSLFRHVRAALVLGALLLLVACQTELNQGLSEPEANDIVALLLENGIPASRQLAAKEGTMTVFVERSRFADAVQLLKAHGLPKQKFANTGTIFTGGGLVNSPTEERARMIFAIEQELSETLSQIDGVLTARVQIVLPNNDRLSRNASPSSASVFLKYDSSAKLDTMVPQIKTLVANSVEGLTYNTVSVVMLASLRAKPPLTEQPAAVVPVAGIWVDRSSVLPLQALIGGACFMGLALLGMIGWQGRSLIMRLRGRQPGVISLR